MSFTPEQVRKVAHLARLSLSEAEVARLSTDLTNVLAYMEQLNELDIPDVKAATHVIPTPMPERPDTVRSWLSRDEALANTAETKDGLVIVPRIVADAADAADAG